MTNNQAEYMGLFHALKLFNKEKHIQITTDSMLVCKQMTGEWKIKNELLKELHKKCMKLLPSKFSIKHTLRDGNKEADKMANMAMDKKTNGEV